MCMCMIALHRARVNTTNTPKNHKVTYIHAWDGASHSFQMLRSESWPNPRPPTGSAAAEARAFDAKMREMWIARRKREAAADDALRRGDAYEEPPTPPNDATPSKKHDLRNLLVQLETLAKSRDGVASEQPANPAAAASSAEPADVSEPGLGRLQRSLSERPGAGRGLGRFDTIKTE